MLLLQHSMFCAIPPSLIQRSPFLHNLPPCPRKPKVSTFRVSSFIGTGFFNDIVQIAHNKVLISACVSVAIGQLSKPFSSVFLYGKEFDIRAVIQAGGFPSSHSSATVAGATLFGLERGFSDPIFGLAVVYAGLIMYDAQGVRREVGIHAKTLNKILLQMQANSSHSKDIDNLGLSKPLKVEGLEKSLLSQEEATSLEPQQANGGLLVKSTGSKLRQTEAEEVSNIPQLKESIGHSEVEVIAGALLGFLVALAVYNF